MWMSMEELAESYRDEARRLDGLIDRAKAHPNPDVLEQERRMRILRSMRKDSYDVYRHLLWLIQTDEPC